MLSFATAIAGCYGAPSSASAGMWQVLSAESSPVHAWKKLFGGRGERGEYMDGYSETAMIQRCTEDYKWTKTFPPEDFVSERADMMSHLYDNNCLWEHVSMVAFAEHYVLTGTDNGNGNEEATAKPFETFQRQKESQPLDRPIFSGVVLSHWEQECNDGNDIERKLEAFQQKGIDYIRLECNFGSADDIGGAAQLADNPLFSKRFGRLAEAARACQDREMVPLVLLQFPWRDPVDSNDYFDQAVRSFAGALKDASVESERVLFETRPPIGVSAQEEKGLRGTERTALGLQIGEKMFEAIEEAFGEDKIAGFCVAGGSTKGDLPTAMEDDTQNAVRQGMRRCAQRQWGYEICFWEMGAKLMLQPKVGRLWGNTESGRDAARELFRVNAEDLADEIKSCIVVP